MIFTFGPANMPVGLSSSRSTSEYAPLSRDVSEQRLREQEIAGGRIDVMSDGLVRTLFNDHAPCRPRFTAHIDGDELLVLNCACRHRPESGALGDERPLRSGHSDGSMELANAAVLIDTLDHFPAQDRKSVDVLGVVT